MKRCISAYTLLNASLRTRFYQASSGSFLLPDDVNWASFTLGSIHTPSQGSPFLFWALRAHLLPNGLKIIEINDRSQGCHFCLFDFPRNSFLPLQHTESLWTRANLPRLELKVIVYHHVLKIRPDPLESILHCCLINRFSHLDSPFLLCSSIVVNLRFTDLNF